MSFIIYDTETSGINTTFDQIFQFAAILADDNLQEIDSFSLRCRRLPHIVPSPGALVVTGVRPKDIEEAPLSHYEMMSEVCKRFEEWSRSGAVFLGYNSIRFDEVLLRQAYYQNLLPLYQTNTRGNVRADVMRMVQACAVYCPNAIAIPLGDKGQAVFKLGEVARVNGIDLLNAHEALADTRATMEVARLVRDKAPAVWKYMMQNATKRGVDTSLKPNVLCFSDVFFGKASSSIVTEAARNPNDAADIALFDLSYEPEPYLNLSEQELTPWVTGKVKIVRRIRSSNQPMLFPLDAAPDTFLDNRLDLSVYEARANLIRNHAAFRETLGQVLSHRYEDEPPSTHIEEQIYDGFPTDTDLAHMRQFHGADWQSRVGISDKIQDKRFRQLAKRLIYFEKPDLLPQDMQERFHEGITKRMQTDDETVPWMTIPKALKECGDFRKSGDAQPDLVDEIEGYLLALA